MDNEIRLVSLVFARKLKRKKQELPHLLNTIEVVCVLSHLKFQYQTFLITGLKIIVMYKSQIIRPLHMKLS